MYKYPVSKPNLDGNELKYLTEAINTGWISSQGPFVGAFEKAFANYVGTREAVACSSGTAALTLSLVALGIGKGDEVIVPEFTMIASAYAVTYTGATPVFVDCGEDLNIDVNKIEEKITPRTKAIMPVHIYGRPCDMTKILAIAEKRKLQVVEDACEAHGATYDGRKVGTFGIAGCFSLFANKIISAGEGGVITTNDTEYAKRLRYLRGMAFEPNHTFLHQEIGFNFRMTNLQAAVALAQVIRIDEFLEKRRKIQGWYDEYLSDYTMPRPEGSVLWMYDIVTNSRDRVMSELENVGIESRCFFKPMSMQPCLAPKDCSDLCAYYYSQRGLYLPTYTDLTKSDVTYIAGEVLKLL